VWEFPQTSFRGVEMMTMTVQVPKHKGFALFLGEIDAQKAEISMQGEIPSELLMMSSTKNCKIYLLSSSWGCVHTLSNSNISKLFGGQQTETVLDALWERQTQEIRYVVCHDSRPSPTTVRIYYPNNKPRISAGEMYDGLFKTKPRSTQ